jgi:hypothetical protein
MKFLYCFIFILTIIAIVWLGNKQLLVATKAQDRKSNSTLLGFLITLATLAAMLGGYCVLTQTAFPFRIYLMLACAYLFAYLLNSFLTAIAGIAIREKKNKINVLSGFITYRDIVDSKPRQVIQLILAFIPYVVWIATIVLFFSFPLGDKAGHAWIALTLFALPQMIQLIFTTNSVVPLLVSEYLDDDLRNSILCQYLSGMLTGIIYFIFPYFIIRSSGSLDFSWVPEFWIITVALLLSNIVLVIAPFYVGVKKYSSQRRNFLWFRQSFLENCRSILSSPEPDAVKRAALDRKIDELDEKIALKIQDSSTWSAFQNFTKPGGATKWEERFRQNIMDHKDEIQSWDKELASIQRLEEIRKSLASDNFAALKTFLDEKLEEVEKKLTESKKGKNILAGAITTVLVGAISYVLEAFHEPLAAWLKEIVFT